jgi:hypothetical protein
VEHTIHILEDIAIPESQNNNPDHAAKHLVFYRSLFDPRAGRRRSRQLTVLRNKQNLQYNFPNAAAGET